METPDHAEKAAPAWLQCLILAAVSIAAATGFYALRIGPSSAPARRPATTYEVPPARPQSPAEERAVVRPIPAVRPLIHSKLSKPLGARRRTALSRSGSFSRGGGTAWTPPPGERSLSWVTWSL